MTYSGTDNYNIILSDVLKDESLLRFRAMANLHNRCAFSPLIFSWLFTSLTSKVPKTGHPLNFQAHYSDEQTGFALSPITLDTKSSLSMRHCPITYEVREPCVGSRWLLVAFALPGSLSLPRPLKPLPRPLQRPPPPLLDGKTVTPLTPAGSGTCKGSRHLFLNAENSASYGSRSIGLKCSISDVEDSFESAYCLQQVRIVKEPIWAGIIC